MTVPCTHDTPITMKVGPSMKSVAIAANVVQLAIILIVFFIGGLKLGPWVIGLLFLLMPIPFINSLTILLAQRSVERLSLGRGATGGLIKREAMRVVYPADRCPSLHAGETAYAVLDLSEGGVRIRAGAGIPFKRKIRGEILLISGGRIAFKAILLRREEGETTFQFTDPVGTAVLMAEKRALSTRRP